VTRYRALRRIGCDPLAAALVAVLNWLQRVPANEIRVLTTVVEIDPESVS
jgi:hypothetical protein